jgi:hypothetical protein
VEVNYETVKGKAWYDLYLQVKSSKKISFFVQIYFGAFSISQSLLIILLFLVGRGKQSYKWRYPLQM